MTIIIIPNIALKDKTYTIYGVGLVFICRAAGLPAPLEILSISSVIPILKAGRLRLTLSLLPSIIAEILTGPAIALLRNNKYFLNNQ
jgi:hypothetical protein